LSRDRMGSLPGADSLWKLEPVLGKAESGVIGKGPSFARKKMPRKELSGRGPANRNGSAELPLGGLPILNNGPSRNSALRMRGSITGAGSVVEAVHTI
jgi:hypothetical protein